MPPRGSKPGTLRSGGTGAVKLWALVAAVVATLAIGTAASLWDESRESRAVLGDMAEEQAVLAAAASSGLSHALRQVVRDALLITEALDQGHPPSPEVLRSYVEVEVPAKGFKAPKGPAPASVSLDITVPGRNGESVRLRVPLHAYVSGLDRLESPGSLHCFLLPPGSSRLQTLDGRSVNLPGLREAIQQGQRSWVVPRAEAGRLGLPSRLAMAGLALADGGAAGSWGVAVVATAYRERDRAIRARLRMFVTLGLMGVIILVFGSLALRVQREELQMARQLEINELRRQKDLQLNQASRAATMLTFAAGVAHEISTPLGVIAGWAEQLEAHSRDDEWTHKGLQSIQDEADRIGRIVRRFLDLARGGAASVVNVSALDLAGNAVAMVEHRFHRAQVILETDFSSDLPDLRGDARLLEHAMVNLLLNACDASQPGGRVKLAARPADGGVTFEVLDEGTGIPSDIAAKVMEPFFSTKSHERGTGLGLAIALEIVKMHRGELKLEAVSPHGTRASIHLPAS